MKSVWKCKTCSNPKPKPALLSNSLETWCPTLQWARSSSEEDTHTTKPSTNTWPCKCQAWIKWWCSRWFKELRLRRDPQLDSISLWRETSSNNTGKSIRVQEECLLRVNQTQEWRARPWCTITSRWEHLTCIFKVTWWTRVTDRAETWCSRIRAGQLSQLKDTRGTSTTVFT